MNEVAIAPGKTQQQQVLRNYLPGKAENKFLSLLTLLIFSKPFFT